MSRQRNRKRNLRIFIQKKEVSFLLLLIARNNKPWQLPGITGISFFVHSIYSALMYLRSITIGWLVRAQHRIKKYRQNCTGISLISRTRPASAPDIKTSYFALPDTVTPNSGNIGNVESNFEETIVLDCTKGVFALGVDPRDADEVPMTSDSSIETGAERIMNGPVKYDVWRV
jgi:hypothetical protein